MDGYFQSSRGNSVCHTSESLLLIGFARLANNTSPQIPEKYCPCTFDIVGGSHQIFHLVVLVAACVHYVGLIHAFKAIRQ